MNLTATTEKSAVRRKIDWRIMPLAAWACGLQFVDKVREPKMLEERQH